jgi:hypothetical protein
MAFDQEKAVVRPKIDFFYTPGETKEIAPKRGFRGCYLFKHKANPGARSPKERDAYSLILYVDADAAPVNYVMNDDGDGLVVDVQPGCALSEVEAAVVKYLRAGLNPNDPQGGPGSVKTNP